MKRLVLLLGLAAMALFLVPAGIALAYPGLGDGTVGGCLSCHGGAGAAGDLFRGQHDGAIGECSTCHTTGTEPIHGEWTETADACARCHRTHSAAGAHLLALEPSALCEFCHGNTEGNAQTNVLGGVLRYNGGSLRGGGFETVIMNHTTNVPDTTAGDPEVDDLWRFPIAAEGSWIGAISEDTTSTHSLGVEALIWGSRESSATRTDWFTEPTAGATSTALECTSCHDPHAYGETYRMLKGQPTDSSFGYHNSTEYVYVTDQLAWAEHNPTSGILSYTTDDYTDIQEYVSPEVLDAAGDPVLMRDVNGDPLYYSGTTTQVVKHSQQLSNWCSACHARYQAEKGNRTATGSTTPTTDAIFMYRHKTGDSMLDYDQTESCGYRGAGCHGGPMKEDLNRQLACLGCHVAHGTAAAMTPFAQLPWPGQAGDTLFPGTAVDPSLPAAWDDEWDTRSSLLRVDNRGVCQNAYCHPKGGGELAGHEQGHDY